MGVEIENAVLYPIFLNLSGRRCVVVGGGEVASRKAWNLFQAGAEVVVISPELNTELESIAAELHRRAYREGDLDGAYLVFAATDVREVNAAVAREARERGIMVNVADEPSEGNFSLPSILRRGRLQVAVSTGGASPALARSIRRELEGVFGPEWADLVRRVGEARKSGKADEELEKEVRGCLSRLRG